MLHCKVALCYRPEGYKIDDGPEFAKYKDYLTEDLSDSKWMSAELVDFLQFVLVATRHCMLLVEHI